MKPTRQTLPPQKTVRRARALVDGRSRLAANVGACATPKTAVGGGVGVSVLSACDQLSSLPSPPKLLLVQVGRVGGGMLK